MSFRKMLNGSPTYTEEEGRESSEETCWTEGCSEDEDEEGYVSEEEKNPGIQQRMGVDSWLWADGRVHTSFQWQDGFKIPVGSQLGSHSPLIPCDCGPLIPCDCGEERTSSPLYEVLQPGSWQEETHTEAHVNCTIPATDSHISEKNLKTSRRPKLPAVNCCQAKASSPGTEGLFSSRILSHPSFISYYTAVAILQRSQGSHEAQPASADPAHERSLEEGSSGEVLPINYSDFFYTDPLMTPGHRIYNCLSPQSQQVFKCFRLNTPPPIMSYCEQSAPRRPQAYIDFHSSGVPRTSDSFTAGGKIWSKWLSIDEHDALSALLDMTNCANPEPVLEPTISRSKVYTDVQELPLPSQDVLQEPWGMSSPCNIEVSPVDPQTQMAGFYSEPYDQPLLGDKNLKKVQYGGQELWQGFLNQEACETAGNLGQSYFGTVKEHHGTALCVTSTDPSNHVNKEAPNTQTLELVEHAEWKKTQEGLAAPVLGQAHTGHYSPSEHIAISALLDLQLLRHHKLSDESLLSTVI